MFEVNGIISIVPARFIKEGAVDLGEVAAFWSLPLKVVALAERFRRFDASAKDGRRSARLGMANKSQARTS